MRPAAELDPRPTENADYVAAALTLPFRPTAAAAPVLFYPESGGVRGWSISLVLNIPGKNNEEYMETAVDLARKIHLPQYWILPLIDSSSLPCTTLL